MFAISPYLAEREVIDTEGRPASTSWQPCRVIGIDKDADGDFSYIVETVVDGCCFLEREPYVRKLERGNPL